MVLDTSGFLGGSYFRWLKFSEVTINATRRTLHGRTIKGFTRFQEDSKDSQDSKDPKRNQWPVFGLRFKHPSDASPPIHPSMSPRWSMGTSYNAPAGRPSLPRTSTTSCPHHTFQYKYYMAPTGSVLVPCRIRSYPIFPCVGH